MKRPGLLRNFRLKERTKLQYTTLASIVRKFALANNKYAIHEIWFTFSIVLFIEERGRGRSKLC